MIETVSTFFSTVVTLISTGLSSFIEAVAGLFV